MKSTCLYRTLTFFAAFSIFLFTGCGGQDEEQLSRSPAKFYSGGGNVVTPSSSKAVAKITAFLDDQKTSAAHALLKANEAKLAGDPWFQLQYARWHALVADVCSGDSNRSKEDDRRVAEIRRRAQIAVELDGNLEEEAARLLVDALLENVLNRVRLGQGLIRCHHDDSWSIDSMPGSFVNDLHHFSQWNPDVWKQVEKEMPQIAEICLTNGNPLSSIIATYMGIDPSGLKITEGGQQLSWSLQEDEESLESMLDLYEGIGNACLEGRVGGQALLTSLLMIKSFVGDELTPYLEKGDSRVLLCERAYGRSPSADGTRLSLHYLNEVSWGMCLNPTSNSAYRQRCLKLAEKAVNVLPEKQMPTDGEGNTALGLGLITGDFSQVELSQVYGFVLNTYGVALYRSGDCEKAINILNLAIKCDVEYKEAEKLGSAMQALQGNPFAFGDDFDEEVDPDPINPLCIAMCHAKLGNRSDASNIFRRLPSRTASPGYDALYAEARKLIK